MIRRTKRSIATAVAAGATALALALTGCAPTAETGVESRPLRVWAGSATPINHNFNPFNVDTAVHATYGAIYEPLFFFNQLSSEPPVGLIGDSYEFSEDGTVITVTLKPDLTWSDGEPLTAADVAFTFGYGPNTSDDMVSAQPVDDTTVVLTFSKPQFTRASLILGSTWIVPEHIWGEIDDYMAETNPEPVGSGPYVVKDFTEASYTVTANEQFRDGAPAVKEVQYIGIDGNQSSQDLLATGQLDWVGQFISNPESVTGNGVISTLNLQQDPTVIVTCSSAELGCTGPQTDPAVRQAINVAIDRSTIREKAFAGLAGEATPTFMLLPRDEGWLSDPILEVSPQESDAAEASGILEAAGYTKGVDGFYAKNGQTIELDLFSPDGWTDYNDAAKLIAEQAAEAGIKITARTVSDADYWTPISAGDFQLAMYGLAASLVADPYSTYSQYFASTSTATVGDDPVSGQNYARYGNPAVDAAIVAAGATQDEATKRDAYSTIHAEIVRDLPYIPVVLNASQSFFNTKDYTGWPSESDLYAVPLPYTSVANAVLLTHLSPVS